MGTRSRSSSMAVLLLIAITVAVGLGWFLAKRSVDLSSTTAVRPEQAAPVLQRRQVHLYFADRSGRYLSAEQRVVEQPADVASAARQLVAALIHGPLQGGTRTLPQDSSLRNIFVTPDGDAFVDFKSDALDHHPGGVETELLTIYSIVDTLVLNLEPVRRVKFLIGGQEAATLAGHVDLSRPFRADMLWIR
jgi:Sporulation and spore germination